MKAHDQIIAIGQVCGWTKCRLTVLGAGGPERKPSPHGIPPGRNYEVPLPDYLNDLNAMNSAEKVLTDLDKYFDELGWVVYRAGSTRIFSASAAQRAEAFLKTLNLWVPEKSEP